MCFVPMATHGFFKNILRIIHLLQACLPAAWDAAALVVHNWRGGVWGWLVEGIQTAQNFFSFSSFVIAAEGINISLPWLRLPRAGVLLLTTNILLLIRIWFFLLLRHGLFARQETMIVFNFVRYNNNIGPNQTFNIKTSEAENLTENWFFSRNGFWHRKQN